MIPHRTERVSQAIREELEELIAYEMDDPRVGSAMVTQVHVSPDLRHAMVEVGFANSGEAAEAIRALDGARGFLRRELSRRLDLHRVPELHFESDLPVRLGGKMEHLLKRVRKGRPKDDGA